VRDPRHYQIAVLATLLIYGLIALDFEITGVSVAEILGASLLTQFACTRLWKMPQFDPRSSLISGLSLCLLFRSNSTAWTITAAAITIVSKFAIRFKGKHLFNPTNFGVFSMILFTVDAWVSP